MGTDRTREHLTGLLGTPLADLGIDLESVEVTAAGRRRLVRVAVDKDGGVSLDDVADATKAISRLLDEDDVMGEQPYVLEVGSPGVDRPLTLPRHWRRNTSRLVKVALADGTSVTGRVVEAGDQAAHLDVDGERREVAYAAVSRATVQVEFRHPEET